MDGQVNSQFEVERCSECGSINLTVINSRPNGRYRRRRRKCRDCGYKYSTIEMTDEEYKHLEYLKTKLAETMQTLKQLSE